jgi:D-alanine-D-alanine ligase-like ATP-grasp enzyme
LIEEKNQEPGREPPTKTNATLHQIEFNEALTEILNSQQVNLEMILPLGRKIHLARKVTLGMGADIYNATAEMHPETKEMLEKLSAELKVPLVGYDFICADIAKSFREQEFGLIEANSLPYIDMHHFPSVGSPIDVAAAVWDFALANLEIKI